MSSPNSWGVTSRALRLAALEPMMYRRKASVFIPLGIVFIFAVWAAAATQVAPYDDRSLIILLLQLGSMMIPLLIGSTVLILVNEDRDSLMALRKQSFGFTLREIGFSKTPWAIAVAFGGLVVVTLALVASGHSIGLTPDGNYLAIILLGLSLEIICLVPLFLNLAFRHRGQVMVLALALGGAVLGSLAGFLPRYIAAVTPYTLAGAVTPVRVIADEISDTSVPITIPSIVLVVTATLVATSVAVFPRRATHE